jgi:LmbE family N-acetylglucosaminyl deacetylase
MQKIMAIFAHPDDEGVVGGTLAAYARQGMEVTLVCATRGEAGEISDPALATAETLGTVRQKELDAACEILGIQQLYFLDYCDSGMAGTAENGRPTSFVRADPVEVLGKLVGLMRQLKPDIVITFEPFGWYGHPDHQATSRWATAAYTLAGDAAAYPDKGRAWQPRRLFHAVIPVSTFQTMLQEAAASGNFEVDNIAENIPVEQQLKTEAAVTHIVDVTPLFDIKQNAMRAHHTQFSEEHMFSKMPRETIIKAMGNEYFIQVFPVPAESLTQDPLLDLFAGL